jgi:hypothetical protein
LTTWEYSRRSPIDESEAAPDLAHDPKFWSGYWQNTFERLFALGQFQKHVDKSPMLHVESDVILFPIFPFKAITSLSTLAWSRVSEKYDVAALVFSPNPEAFSELLVALRNQALSHPETNDMLALSEFSRNNSNKFSELPPILPNGQDLGERHGGPLLHKGIFDGGSLGSWFTGQDPRNYWGIRRRYMTLLGSPRNYSRTHFAISDDGNLFVDEVPVYSLHVHSKNLGYFDVENAEFLRDEVALVSARRNRIYFSLSALFVFLRTHYKDFLFAMFNLEKWKALFRRKFSIK